MVVADLSASRFVSGESGGLQSPRAASRRRPLARFVRRFHAGTSVDLLAERVNVPEVLCGLLDQAQQDPPVETQVRSASWLNSAPARGVLEFPRDEAPWRGSTPISVVRSSRWCAASVNQASRLTRTTTYRPGVYAVLWQPARATGDALPVR